MAKYETLLPRFLRYVKVNTRSNPNSSTVPTDPKEVEFLKTLAKELEEVGVVDVHTQPSSGYVVGTLPANDDGNTPVIGYISHVDTADFNAENIQPQVHKTTTVNLTLTWAATVSGFWNLPSFQVWRSMPATT